MNDTVVLLFSGGLESTSLLLYYEDKKVNTELLYIKFGFIWEKAELLNIKKNIVNNMKLHIIDLSKAFNYSQLGFVDTPRKNIIPNRNLSLLFVASTYAYNIDIFKIAIGLQGNTEYPDTSKKYIKSLEELIKVGLEENSFEIQMPFYGLSKPEILKKYLDRIELDKVFSCTNPINNKPCNSCYKCNKLNKLKSKTQER